MSYSYENFLNGLVEVINNNIKNSGFLFIKKYEISNMNEIEKYFVEELIKYKDEIKCEVNSHFSFDGMTLKEAKEKTDFFHSYLDSLLIRLIDKFYYGLSLYLSNPRTGIMTKEKLLYLFSKEVNILSFVESCDKCGEFVDYYLDLTDLTFKTYSEDKCSVEKIKDYEVSIQTPSKKIVVSSSFHNILSDNRKYSENLNINFYKSKKEMSKRYEKDNIAFMLFPDVSLSLYKNKETKDIFLLNGEKEVNEKKLELLEYIDLSTVSIIDYDLFMSLLEKKNMDIKDFPFDYSIIETQKENLKFHSFHFEKNKLLNDVYMAKIELF